MVSLLPFGLLNGANRAERSQGEWRHWAGLWNRLTTLFTEILDPA